MSTFPTGPRLPRRGPRGPARGLDLKSLRDALDEGLKEKFPDPDARRAEVDRLLGGDRPTTVPPPGRAAPESGGRRYLAATPVWFDVFGNVRISNGHAPSGYGTWPLARTAARTGGRYVFYPFPEGEWLDTCPSDLSRLDELAPELVSRTRYLSRRAGDPALDVLCRASALVEPVTPWADGAFGFRAASGWSSFERAAPLAMERDAFLRRFPWDNALSESEQEMQRRGVRILEQVLPRYDDAARLVEDAYVRSATGRMDGAHPRSVANLCLARFHLAMSAFHLEAYGLYAREVERLVPDSMKGHVERIHVTYVPTIRMSDCLDAYDGRVLTAADEERYARWVPEDAPGYQGNLLEIPADDPNYRARRGLDRVLEHLDPRLRRRALLTIRAASDVMRRYGKTGWGWTTYYADAFAFVFQPVETERGHRPATGESAPAAKPPTTPVGPDGTPGGSAPGGPKTK
jgi:hypothetical protein